MSERIYKKLARHLDDLPGGYPATESGVELRILRRLFTPQQAALAVHLTLLAEEASLIANRAGIPLQEAEAQLEEMASKGLIYSAAPDQGQARYMAAQFVVGIWEHQVNNLSPELIQDVDEYLPTLFDARVWKEAPQLRTIPVGESISPQLEVMPYEQAEALIREQEKITVAPCICRRERRIAGEGCGKPEEVCLSFGGGADFYRRNGYGRPISVQEALDILKIANEAGLVLQPGNSKKAGFICCCCGDCCGVLRNIKRYPNPASLVASPFRASIDTETCTGCGDCELRCQMEAISVGYDGAALLDPGRCIGCGLCVSACPSESVTLVRKPQAEQPYVPRKTAETYLRLARARRKIPTLAVKHVKSGMDRLKGIPGDS